jgi:hypothetical protein
VINNWNTIYSVIRVAAENIGFRTSCKDHNLRPSQDTKEANRLGPGMFANVKVEEFDLVWFDIALEAEIVRKLKPYQRINQWPGISVLSHKNKLAHNLKMMQRHYPNDYNFFP